MARDAASQGGLVIVSAVYGIAEAVDAFLAACDGVQREQMEGSEAATSAGAQAQAQTGGSGAATGHCEDDDRCLGTGYRAP